MDHTQNRPHIRPVRIGFMAAALSLAWTVADAAPKCGALEVLDALSICRSADGCPPGEYLHSVILRNKSDRRLYVAYRFRDPRGVLTRGGLDIAPASDIERPIGFGRVPITPDEPDGKRIGRFVAASCGFNESTKFTWKK